jgi:hypothetical protein
VRRITASAELAGRCLVVVDATGGRAVVDLLRRARLEGGLAPVVATSGRRESRAAGYYRVPKRNLILGMHSMLARGRVRIASGLRDKPALMRELQQMELRLSPHGRERFGSWHAGEHDDLVFAMALACWGAEKILSAAARPAA